RDGVWKVGSTSSQFRIQKQQDKNFQIDSEDIEIDPYHRATRDQSTIPLIEEVIRENDQDQEVIRDREIIMVQEKLKWTSIEIRMNTKPDLNREIGDEEPSEEGIRIIKKEDKATRIQIILIMKDIERRKKEGWGDDPNDEWTKRAQIQKDSIENHNDKDSTRVEDEATQHQVATPQPKQPVQHIQRIQEVQIQPKQQTPVQIPRQRGRKDAVPNQNNIGEQEMLQEKLAALQKGKEQYGISDSEND
ncbi:MAG: hypothetical protein EZS28_041530, partial [Streblomastix strix]